MLMCLVLVYVMVDNRNFEDFHRKFKMSLPAADYDSVDLTEDEDSREGEYLANNFAFPHVNTSTPPPLTPIQKFKSFQDNALPAGYVARIPKLKKINTKDQPVLLSKPPETNLTPLNVNSSMEVVYIESDPDEFLVQSDMKPKSSHLRTTNSFIVESELSSMNRPPGKLIVIKKNNKLYRIVIPHNVMPSANQSAGPVLINIPEVGPLMITLDPNVKNQPKSNECNQLKPFSLNFDTIYEKANIKSNFEKIKTKPIFEPICKPKMKVNNNLSKYKCWMPKLKLSVTTETQGFTKLETNAARACAGGINLCIKKKCSVLQKHIRSFEMFQKEALKRNNIKPVKLTKILGNRKFGNCSKTCHEPLSITKPNNECLKKKDINIPLDTCYSDSNYFDDLLLTKKVVILNNGSTEEEEEQISSTGLKRGRRKKGKLRWNYNGKRQLPKKTNNNINPKINYENMKTCFVKMTRNKEVEAISLKYSQNRKPVTPSNKRRTSKNTVERLTEAKELEESYKANESKYFKDTSLTLLQKLIDTEDKLLKEMYFLKPTLVLNETNFKLVQYNEEFSKSNIVFPVNEDRGFAKSVLTHYNFIIAVNFGYVKLVDSDLLCEFLVGDLVPKSPSL